MTLGTATFFLLAALFLAAAFWATGLLVFAAALRVTANFLAGFFFAVTDFFLAVTDFAAALAFFVPLVFETARLSVLARAALATTVRLFPGDLAEVRDTERPDDRLTPFVTWLLIKACGPATQPSFAAAKIWRELNIASPVNQREKGICGPAVGPKSAPNVPSAKQVKTLDGHCWLC